MTPIEKWTDETGKVLLLKSVSWDGGAYGGFKWPLQVGAVVTAPDWNPETVCGGGFHAWPWGLGVGTGKSPKWMCPWLVLAAKPEDVVLICGVYGYKAKVREAEIRHVGDFASAYRMTLEGLSGWVDDCLTNNPEQLHGCVVDRGVHGTAVSRYGGQVSVAYGLRSTAVSAGPYGTSVTHAYNSAAVSVGSESSALTTRSGSIAATVGSYSLSAAAWEHSAAVATGERSCASADGYASLAASISRGGAARAGKNGVIVLALHGEGGNVLRLCCARTAGGGEEPDGKTVLKPDTWYCLDMFGNFIEVR